MKYSFEGDKREDSSDHLPVFKTHKEADYCRFLGSWEGSVLHQLSERGNEVGEEEMLFLAANLYLMSYFGKVAIMNCLCGWGNLNGEGKNISQ